MIYYGVSLSFPILNMFTLRTETVDAFPNKVDCARLALFFNSSEKCSRLNAQSSMIFVSLKLRLEDRRHLGNKN